MTVDTVDTVRPVCPTCRLLQSTLSPTLRCGLKRAPTSSEPCWVRDQQADIVELELGALPNTREGLQEALLAVFGAFGMSVGVGLIKDGVAIRSQDKRVDAQNVGIIEPYDVEDTKKHLSDNPRWPSG